MGVPAFFRWLTAKYPKVLVPAIEEAVVNVDGLEMEVDLTGPNPNGIEFDNLYLDMNGLVHPCCHPETGSPPKDEEEMMLRVFAAIDEIVAVVRPRKLLYMAMDGVAPRAKMNQQRARRFKAAMDSQLGREAEEIVRKELADRGVTPPPPRPPSWDHNVITPGTLFMENLGKAIHWYIHDRMNREPAWQQLRVVLSDSNQPGEGEHKIANYIRQVRLLPGYDPNTKHCLHGLDADLVMLALASHEPYFTIVRDHIDFKNPAMKGRNKEEEPPGTSNFDFLHVHILREYLQVEFGVLKSMPLPMEYDFERCVDDWIFICFFVGNDFLPHLPSLEIREGALDDLLEHYCSNLDKIGGYLTDQGDVDMSRVAYMLFLVGQQEERVLSERIAKEVAKMRKIGGKLEAKKKERLDRIKSVYSDLNAVATKVKEGTATLGQNLKTAEEFVLELLSFKKEDLNDVEGKQADSVRYGEPGWKERYYQSKFEAKTPEDIVSKASDAAQKYFEGLVWVFRYYMQGCASWKWFYPYHYSPFPSDLSACVDPDNKYEMEVGTPFLPFEQLMGVLPAASKKALPSCYHFYMEDASSPIIDIYPKEFPIDTEGRRFAWQGVVILPWINEHRLLSVLKPLEKFLTPEEKKRNSIGPEFIFLHSSHPVAKAALPHLYPEEGGEPAAKRPRVAAPVFPFETNTRWAVPGPAMKEWQMQGTLRGTGLNVPLGGTATLREYPELDGYAGVVQPIPGNQVLTAIFALPPAQKHVSRLLPGAETPASALTEVDKLPTVRMPGTGHGFSTAHSAQVDGVDPDDLESQAFSQVWQP
eukprot:EG_transcript_3555